MSAAVIPAASTISSFRRMIAVPFAVTAFHAGASIVLRLTSENRNSGTACVTSLSVIFSLDVSKLKTPTLSFSAMRQAHCSINAVLPSLGYPPITNTSPRSSASLSSRAGRPTVMYSCLPCW